MNKFILGYTLTRYAQLTNIKPTYCYKRSFMEYLGALCAYMNPVTPRWEDFQ